MTAVSLPSWVAGQKQSTFHKASVGLFGLMIFLAYMSLGGLIIGYLVFFLVTSLSKVWKMLIFMAIIAAVLAVLPFLAPLAIILMIVLFIMRIGYVIENWKPIVSGLAVYGMAFPLYQITVMYRYGAGGIIEPLLVAAIGACALHFLLILLYKDGYSTKTALGIMGGVPLVILAFILPFLKLHIPVADTVLFEGAAPAEGAVPVEGGPAGHTGSSSVTESTIAHSANKPVSEPVAGKSITDPVIVRPSNSFTNEIVNVKTAAPIHSPAFQQANGGENASIFPAKDQPLEWKTDSNFNNEVYRFQDNIFGGKEITDSQGTKILSTKENIFNGEDLYTPEGKKVGSTQENIFKGYDLYNENNSKVFSTQENISGGENVYNDQNQKIASIRENATGTKDIYDKDGNKVGVIEKIPSS